MDENLDRKTVDEQPEQQDQPEQEQKVTVSVSPKFLYVLFAFASIALLVVAEVVLNFRPNNMNVIRGIMSIPVYVLPVIGIVLSFLSEKGKKPTFEFWLNVGALIVALRFL